MIMNDLISFDLKSLDSLQERVQLVGFAYWKRLSNGSHKVNEILDGNVNNDGIVLLNRQT